MKQRTRFISLLSAFLMFISLVTIPTVTAFAEDIPTDNLPAQTQQAEVPPAETQPVETPPTETEQPVLSSDSRLSSLTVSGGEVNFEMLPAFSADITAYSAAVKADTETVTIAAAAEDPQAKVSGDTGTVSLTTGDNAFKVTVTAQDGTAKDYVLTITRPSAEVKTPDDTVKATCEDPPSDSDSYQGFKFKEEDKYIVITEYEGEDDTVVVPGKINNKPVTKIGDEAFCGRCMSSIVLPNSITDIGKSAFCGCSNLEDITLGSGLINIGDYAFEGCCEIENISLPASLQTIGEGAFKGCGSIETIDIPQNVSSIGSEFVYGCSSIKSITVNDENGNFTTVSGVLFTKDMKTLIACPAMLGGEDGEDGAEDYSYDIPDGVKTIYAGAFAQCGNLTSVTVPGSLSVIPEDCFEDCWNLTDLSLNEGIEVISDSAFEGCCSLRSVELPASLTSVSGLSFAGCPIKVYKFAEGNTAYTTDKGILYSADGKTLVAFPCGYWGEDESEEYGKIITSGKAKASAKIKTLCENVEKYENNIFAIPDSVEVIGRGAFAECAITDIDFGSGVEKIDDYAFYGCGLLQIIDIPNSIKTVGKEAFGNCYTLASVTFGTGLEELSPVAFDSCGKLMGIYFLGDAPNVNTSECDCVFPGSDSNLILYYPLGKEYDTPTWLGYTTAPFDPGKKNTVTYYLNDGTSDVFKTLTVFSGARAVDFYPYSNPGDSFLGWYKDEDCCDPWYFVTDTVTSNVKLYAEWVSEKNAYLDYLWLNDQNWDEMTLSPEFDSKMFEYSVSIGDDQDSFTLFADANYDGAKVYIDGKKETEKEYKNIKPGQVIKCTVAVKAGNQKKQYVVVVRKDVSKNCNLESLIAKSGGNGLGFDSSFDPGGLEYKLELDEYTKSVTIYAEKANSAAKVYIDGKSKASKKYKLSPGEEKECVITVVAQSKDVKVYTVNIKRDPNTDVYLSSLKTNIKKIGLSPRFDRETDSYEVYLPENIGSVVLSAKAEGYKADLSITNNATMKVSKKGNIKVNVGNGESVKVIAEVTAQASTEEEPLIKDYTVTVYRAAKVNKFSASPKNGTVPAISPGGDNKLNFKWTQTGDGTVNIEAYLKGVSDSGWETIYSDDFEEGDHFYDWYGKINDEYLSKGSYKVRISVSYQSDGLDYTVKSSYKVTNVKVLDEPDISLSVSPDTIKNGDDGDIPAKVNVRWSTLSRVKVEVYDGGDLIATLSDTGDYKSAGALVLYWDGTDDEGNAVDPGTYTIKVTAGDATKEASVTVEADEDI